MTVINEERYLVSMLGNEANWVQNVRAAEGKARLRHGISEQVLLEEVDVKKRAPILKAFLQHAPGARPHILVSKDAPVSEFENIASKYPVFRLKIQSPAITILPFQPEDQSAVKDLILAGLKEHWGALDLTRNPDLNDIALSYAGSTFLVAWENGKIIATGALVPRANGTAEIVRMSVATGQRRKGIGRMILQRLCEQAKLNGHKQIVLETTETWTEVIEFYQRFGFQITHHLDGDVYFVLDL